MNLDHRYRVRVEWTGNTGSGTSGYRNYGRDNLVSAEGNAPIEGSADTPFRGTPERWNPEELLLAALSQCHMLSYLHVAASHGVVVTEYRDSGEGTMVQTTDGGGHFVSATLTPVVTVSPGMHAEAGALCFIASSVNFPVGYEPTLRVRP